MSRTSIELAPVTYPADQAVIHGDKQTGELTRISSRPQSRLSEDQRPINPPAAENEAAAVEVSKRKTAIVITIITAVTGISSLLAGVVTVALPTIGRDLSLSPDVLLWPASIYALTCGCTFLISGAIADVVGCRKMYLVGSMLQSAFTLGCGVATTGTQLILFRALAGVAISFCLPSAVSIITQTFPSGKRRNIAFASMGGGQPIGFSVGLTLGGVFADTVGWRWGFHMAAIINTVIFVVALFGLPNNIDELSGEVTRKRLVYDIDWIGALIAACSLGMLSYVFSVVTGDTSHIREPANIALLCIAIALVPAFIVWVGRQERLGRPAIIPNSLWRNKAFTSICIMVFLVWGGFNAVETFLTFFWQDVQKLSAIETSLRFLPAPIIGMVTNLIIGLIVHKVPADWAANAASVLTTIAPLLMAIAQPQWSYWSWSFLAAGFNPIGADTLYTISNLVITSMFPPHTQALAGAVFNTIAQIGKSIGLATSAVVANSVTAKSQYKDKESPEALLEGYHAAFWYMFALNAVTIAVGFWGLRKIGKVGLKQE